MGETETGGMCSKCGPGHTDETCPKRTVSHVTDLMANMEHTQGMDVDDMLRILDEEKTPGPVSRMPPPEGEATVTASVSDIRGAQEIEPGVRRATKQELQEMGPDVDEQISGMQGRLTMLNEALDAQRNAFMAGAPGASDKIKELRSARKQAEDEIAALQEQKARSTAELETALKAALGGKAG